MTYDEAIEVLSAHNEWHRGGEEMQNPAVIGQAIDVVVAEGKSEKVKMHMLLNEILGQSHEVIQSGGLRFTGIETSKVIDIFKAHGVENKLPF